MPKSEAIKAVVAVDSTASQGTAAYITCTPPMPDTTTIRTSYATSTANPAPPPPYHRHTTPD